MKRVTIGFLGCGNVGSGVWRLLENFAGDIAHRAGLTFYVKKVLVRSLDKKRDIEFPPDVLTIEPEDVLEDPEIEMVVEFLGGEEPAYTHMLHALKNGKTVITANKVAFALHWHELQKAAKKSGAGLYYEAAVCAAIPIIHSLEESLQANRISKVLGIINGTTNYILSRMSRENADYETALKDAQRLGLAEPDPSSDVEGLDAAYKLSILASIAFHGRVPFEDVFVEGITKVTAEDIRCGEELGYTLKLLAIAKRDGLNVETRVHPTFIASDHPLANVNGSFNAVYLFGHACKEMMLLGRGAGDLPTASAIVGDLERAATTTKHRYPTFANELNPKIALKNIKDWKCPFYIRMLASDKPGVLRTIASAFADAGVSIAAVQQKGVQKDGRVTLVIITHTASEKAIRKALDEIPFDTAALVSMIRVEQENPVNESDELETL
ncbi:MAG: homoserine dehydrogenase [Clostridiales bacterium]|nr:homoserine dehydrogenase [Clostridiales bacterium]